MDLETVRRLVTLIIGFITGTIATIVGAPSAGLMQVLIALMVIDYIGGVACAFYGASTKSPDGRLCSAAGLKGLIRKGGIIAVVLVAHLLDIALGKPVTTDITIMFFVINESLSILENVGLLGLPIPKILKRTLTALNEDTETDKKKGD